MELVIVTGMSGAGKSIAVSMLEDIGYYCVDNIPPRIIPSFVDLSRHGDDKLKKMAIVTDMRGGDMFKDIISVLDSLNKDAIDIKVLYLETAENELVRRYKENRRSHPLVSDTCISIAEAVQKEREKLSEIRFRADYILDTTYLSTAQLKQRIIDLFSQEVGGGLRIHCMSFGFKHGSATEADLVFDVRCLPNPYYDETLRPLTGLDAKIKEFVLETDEAKKFLSKITDFIDYSVPLYQKEGKSSLTIAFGCTGGQHRSVTCAELVCAHLTEKGYHPTVGHRDMSKNHL